MSAPSSPSPPSQRHPVASFFHVAFKLAALVTYVTCEWFETHLSLIHISEPTRPY